MAGAVLGLVVGLLAFDGRSAAIVAATLGGVIGGFLYVVLVGSFAGLESPDPGHEPSDSPHPLAEPATEEEHGDPGGIRGDRRDPTRARGESGDRTGTSRSTGRPS